MKTTIRIAKLELNNLMFSPLSWLIMVGLAIYVGVNIFPGITHMVFDHSLHEKIAQASLTHKYFTWPNFGYFVDMATVFMVLVPLLSMGIISRESSTGTIKLLYSSPIKLRSIVIGKYIALMTFVSLMMLILFIGIAFGWASIYQFDIGRVMAAFVAFYFMAALIAAICVFVSTFSSYPIVDAVAGIAVVFGLDLLYNQVRDIDIVSDIFYWLSIVKQIDKPMQGLITSNAIGYFVVLTLMFLVLAYCKMLLKRQVVKARRVTNGIMVLVFVASLGLIYVLNQPTLVVYKDFSRSQSNVLHPESKEKLQAMTDVPVEVTTYVNVFGFGVSNYTYRLKEDHERFFKYRLDYPLIKLNYKFYYADGLKYNYMRFLKMEDDISTDSLLARIADQRKLNQAEFIRYEDIDLDDNMKAKCYGQDFRVIRSGERSSVLQTRFNDPTMQPNEAEITAAFMNAVSDRYHVAVVDGHNGRNLISDNSGYNKMLAVANERGAYINNGACVSGIYLFDEVPEDVDLLILADPTSELEDFELEALNNYIAKGGNLLLTGEPARRDIFNKVAKGLGIEMLAGSLVNDNPDYSAVVNLAELNTDVIGKVRFRAPIQLQTASALQVTKNSPFKVSPLITANEKEAWLSETGPSKFGEITYQPDNGDKKDKYNVALSLEREVNGKQQKIIVAADADMISNSGSNQLVTGVDIGNGMLGRNILRWYTDGLYPLSMKPLPDLDIKPQLKWEHLPFYRILIYVLIPGIFLAIGLFMLIKRMRN